MRRFYEMALKLCHDSPYHVHNKRMACLVIKGGSVLAAATNHTLKHAEWRALRPNRNYDGAVVVVARVNGRISRPCKKCIPKLKEAGISEMFYIDSIGNFVREYV